MKKRNSGTSIRLAMSHKSFRGRARGRMPIFDKPQFVAHRVGDLAPGTDDRLADRQARAQGSDHQVDRIGEQLEQRRGPGAFPFGRRP